MNYPIPRKSAKAFEWLIERNIKPCNPGLIFDRFSPDLLTGDDRTKHEALVRVRDSVKLTEERLLTEWNIRWERLVNSAEAKYFELKTDWRLIAGLGKKGSLEVGFTFHRYGFPYLPGSSLKGLARAYGLLEIAVGIGEDVLKKIGKHFPLETLDKTLSHDEEKKFNEGMESYGVKEKTPLWDKAKAFRYIFGTTEHGGHVIFFDAIPSAIPKLDLDIMNPHYPDYYKEVGSENPKEYPTNWQSPIPVKFLTVAPGNRFRFAVGWRRAPIDASPLDSLSEEKRKEWSWFKGVTQTQPNDLLKQTQEWLKQGLCKLGAGGKTSAGYGYFEE